MTGDLRARLDREFEDCTPDIDVDSASLVRRGRRLKRSRYAVAGTAALALVMALAVVIGNLPRSGGTPLDAPSPSASYTPPPVQPDFPIPGDLDPAKEYVWAPNAFPEFPGPRNGELDRLEAALRAALVAHGINVDPVTRLNRYPQGLRDIDDGQGVLMPADPDFEARLDAMAARRTYYNWDLINQVPGTTDIVDGIGFRAFPKGSFRPGRSSEPDLTSDDGGGLYLVSCEDTEFGGEQWTVDCTDTDLPGGGKLIERVARGGTSNHGEENGRNTAVLYLPNGNAYMIVNLSSSVFKQGGPTLTTAQLGEILRSLPEVVIS